MRLFKTTRTAIHTGQRLGIWGSLALRSLSTDRIPHIAIIGSGPAGFYTAAALLKGHPSAHVDIYERLPVPFGLVRYGVAPDHPNVKNVINTFTQTAHHERCSYLGNVDVGHDVTIKQLQDAYTAVVLAYGAEDDKKCNVPGEDLMGVHSARAFVGWYNGLPEDRNFSIDLTCTDTAVVIGQGNVAIDVARILLTPVDILKKTDITSYALDALHKSKVERVFLVGRRGPLQVAFTTAELREMVQLPGCRPSLDPKDFEPLQALVKDLPRTRRRLTELMIKTALNPKESNERKSWHLHFLRSPKEFYPTNNDTRLLGGVQFTVNELQGVGDQQVAVPTNKTEKLDTGLVFRSIGYKSVAIDSSIPFDIQKGVVPNTLGRVENASGLYCSGWVKRGPIGVIASTMNDGFETADTVLRDLKDGVLAVSENQTGREAIEKIVEQNGKQVVNFHDWENLDKVELNRGTESEKLREKVVDIKEMLTLMK